jgi:hypothetical protein
MRHFVALSIAFLWLGGQLLAEPSPAIPSGDPHRQEWILVRPLDLSAYAQDKQGNAELHKHELRIAGAAIGSN